jgi:hypothetical protein
MTQKTQRRLQKAYQAYMNSGKNNRKDLLARFRADMPEIVYRTTRLEGEPVTRKMVRSHFK